MDFFSRVSANGFFVFFSRVRKKIGVFFGVFLVFFGFFLVFFGVFLVFLCFWGGCFCAFGFFSRVSAIFFFFAPSQGKPEISPLLLREFICGVF